MCIGAAEPKHHQNNFRNICGKNFYRQKCHHRTFKALQNFLAADFGFCVVDDNFFDLRRRLGNRRRQRRLLVFLQPQYDFVPAADSDDSASKKFRATFNLRGNIAFNRRSFHCIPNLRRHYRPDNFSERFAVSKFNLVRDTVADDFNFVPADRRPTQKIFLRRNVHGILDNFHFHLQQTRADFVTDNFCADTD